MPPQCSFSSEQYIRVCVSLAQYSVGVRWTIDLFVCLVVASRKHGSVVHDSSGEEDGGDARSVDSTSVVSSLSYQQQPDHGNKHTDKRLLSSLKEGGGNK